MRANFVVSGVAAGIRRNATMTIALVLSTAIALAFVGAALLANTEITKFKKAYESKINVSVYLCTTDAYANQEREIAQAKASGNRPRVLTCEKGKHTDPVRKDELQKMLNTDPMVDSVSYVSEAVALQHAREQKLPGADLFDVGALPASFTVVLKDLKNDYPAFAARYDRVPGVDHVNNQFATIKTLLDVIDGARWFSIIIALVVLVASVLLIANTIQVAAAQRKNETSIMRLVGASRWMTELPFILETVIAALIGGLISVGLIWLGKHYVLDGIFKVPTENGVIPNLTTNDILVAGGAGIIVGIVLAAVTAFATLRLYVRL
jgi:cell division transport system permease protein